MKIMKVNLKIKTHALTRGSALRRKPNIRKIKMLGYKPRINIEKGLTKTIRWYQKNI